MVGMARLGVSAAVCIEQARPVEHTDMLLWSVVYPELDMGLAHQWERWGSTVVGLEEEQPWYLLEKVGGWEM
jgi:hypothetical protein